MTSENDNNHGPSSWTLLAEGTLTEVWTDGSRIKRPLRPCSEAIHQVLDHLERRGVNGVPRFIRVEDSVEILTLLDGRAIRRPWPKTVQSMTWMERVGHWLHKVHDATSDFRLAGGAQFAWGPNEPLPDHVVTHGDLGPWNMLEQHGNFMGTIDWDLARFGDPLDDLAEAAFELGPLRRNRNMLIEDATIQAIRARINALCRGYGEATPDDVLHHVASLYQRRIHEMRVLARTGNELFVTLVEAGNIEALRKDLQYFQRRFNLD